MPCVCNQRVGRTQPSICCEKCNDCFHLECVDLTQSDADYFAKSNCAFFCKVCLKARRESIRSPPPSLAAATPTTIADGFADDQQSEKPQRSNLAVDQSCDHFKSTECESMLKSLLNEVTALRAENVQVFSLLQSLRDDKHDLLKKVESLRAEVTSMRNAVNCKCASLAVNAVVADVTDVPTSYRTYASAVASASADVAANTVANVAVTNAAAVPSDSIVAASFALPVKTSVNSLSLPANNIAAASAATTDSLPISPNAAAINGGGWSTVGKKRQQHNAKQTRVLGTNKNAELDVAVRLKWFHLSSFQPTVTAENIADYVARHSEIDKAIISCYKLVKNGVALDTLKRINFKIGVPDVQSSKLLLPEFWPANVTIRPFRFFQDEQQQPSRK